MFIGGKFIRKYIYILNQEKIFHDYLRGYGSLHDFKRLGIRI